MTSLESSCGNAGMNLFSPVKQNPVRVALKGPPMPILLVCLRRVISNSVIARFGAVVICGALALALSLSARAQQPASTPPPATTPATPTPAPDAAQQPAQEPTHQSATAAPEHPQEAGITEEELKQMLVGKPLYLRGGYLDNSLSFGEHGTLIGHSAQGSYTLSAIQIDRVRLTKHKVELEGARYGLHFLGALPYENPTRALDRVKITPKKKVVKISIDRELVVTPKKKKDNEKDKGLKAKSLAPTPAGPGAAATQAAAPAQQTGQPAPAPKEMSAEDEAKAEMAAAPVEERPADPSSVTTTTSPAHATKVLKDALDNVFAQGLDARMMAAMPDFWKLYYQGVAARSDYRPADPNVLRQNTVDRKAKLVTNFVPESNEWAQASGIAGPALYHAVIGADGKPGEIAIALPIGFGLDENAVESIRKATFKPAIKDGKPVPVMLDLYVSFRIYSKRTSVSSKQQAEDKTPAPLLPGPYTVQQQQQPQQQP